MWSTRKYRGVAPSITVRTSSPVIERLGLLMFDGMKGVAPLPNSVPSHSPTGRASLNPRSLWTCQELSGGGVFDSWISHWTSQDRLLRWPRLPDRCLAPWYV